MLLLVWKCAFFFFEWGKLKILSREGNNFGKCLNGIKRNTKKADHDINKYIVTGSQEVIT